MTRLDAIGKYMPAKIVDCPVCFFGIMVGDLCTNCDGQDAISSARKNQIAILQARALNA